MNSQPIKFMRLHPTALIPKSWTEGSIGVDLHAHLKNEQGRSNTTMIPSRATRDIPTGLAIEPPPGYFLMVCTRSGLAKQSLFVTNSPGIIDPDYRGEIRILLYNGSFETLWVKDGDRIAQLIAVPATFIQPQVVDVLSTTERGSLGFGSTGL